MTSPDPPAGDSPAGAGEQRWCVAGSARSRRWGWIVAAVSAVVVALVAGGIFLSLPHKPPPPDTERWSALQLPHQVPCTVDMPPNLPTGADPADAGRLEAQQVTLSHPGGQRVKLSVQFAGSPMIDSLPYWISLFGRGDTGNVTIFSPDNNTQTGWYARRMDYIRRKKNGDRGVPAYRDGNLLDSFRLDGNSMELVVDLDNQPGLFGPGPFRPTVVVTASPFDQSTYPTLSWCRWD